MGLTITNIFENILIDKTEPVIDFNLFNNSVEIERNFTDIYTYLKYTKRLQPIVFGRFLQSLLKIENREELIKFFDGYEAEYIDKLIHIVNKLKNQVKLADVLIEKISEKQ